MSLVGLARNCWWVRTRRITIILTTEMPSEQNATMSDVPGTNTIPAGELIDRLCDEFEAGWLAGRPVPLEDVVRAAPEASREPLFRELLAVEQAYRSRDGRPVTPDEARARFAPLGTWADRVIREVFAATGTWGGPPHAPPDAPDKPLAPYDEPAPASIGGYPMVRKLGGGGMGIVYLCADPLGGRQVAVKAMRKKYAEDPLARERFLREARSAMAVEHDNVVPVYQVGLDGDSPFLVMPALKGESLEDRLAREPLPPLELVFKVGREVALGLAAAHDRKLVHRDVKPGNTWLEGEPGATPDARVRRVKVLDFGLARAVDGIDGLTLSGSVMGTPAYMAPEQARGEKVDGRADLFSLGAILYRMATGRRAFQGETLSAVLTAIATHDPPPANGVNPAVPAALSALIGQLLEKEPGMRPQSAGEVVSALEGIEKGSTPAEPPQVASRTHRKRWLVCGGVLLVLCVVGVGARSLFHDPSSGRTAPGEANGTSPPVTDAGERPVSPPVRVEPLRVKSLDVKHYTNTAMGDVERGLLGRTSFAPRLGDKVEVVARLSRPGYAYVVAFRPDGVAELCFPNDEDAAPPRTDVPQYSLAVNGEVYGLREGAGLWVFAVVASEKPLPTFRRWRAARKLNWKSEPVPPGLVWWYDGAVLETLAEGRASEVRGKGEELTGPAATVRTLGRTLEQAPDVTIGVLGFGVGQRN
jgi:serine/threonine protein kinase